METAAPSTGQVAGSGAPGVLPSVRRGDSRSERLWRGLRDDNSSIDQSPVMLSHRSDPETSSEPLSRSSPGLAVVPADLVGDAADPHLLPVEQVAAPEHAAGDARGDVLGA